jgi:RNA polymerase sigma factor (sigma-70 family)
MGPPLSAPASVRGLERIYRDHHARVRWVLRARGVDEGQLDDLVHEVFLAIHRRLAQRTCDVPLAKWVDGVARNVAFSHRRSLASATRMTAQIVASQGPRTPDEELERKEGWRALADFLASLPAEQRELFVLVEVLGLSVNEVARDVDVPINTLHSRLRLARKRFADRFVSLASDDAATQAFLRRAQAEARPNAASSRRAWGLIAMKLGHTAKAVGLGAIAGTLGGVAVAVGVVVGAPLPPAVPTPTEIRPAFAAAPREPARPHVRSSPLPTPIEAEDDAIEILEEPAVAAKPRVRRAPPPRDDPEAQIDLLRRARRFVAERPHEALALIDDYAAQFGRGALDRERFVIERDAACRAHRIDRARKAAAVLVTLDVTVRVDDPCRRTPIE